LKPRADETRLAPEAHMLDFSVIGSRVSERIARFKRSIKN
jgi:hypothetical protein